MSFASFRTVCNLRFVHYIVFFMQNLSYSSIFPRISIFWVNPIGVFIEPIQGYNLFR